jgi:hypothetical protein
MGEMTPFKYAGFWDVPRYLVVRHHGMLLLLQGEFDDSLDEYPDDYAVYLLSGPGGDSLPQLTLNFFAETPRTLIGKISITSVVFDPTKRQELDASCLDHLLNQRDITCA